MDPKQLVSPIVSKECFDGGILINIWKYANHKNLKTYVNLTESKMDLKKRRYFRAKFDGRGIVVFSDNHFFESFRFPKTHKPPQNTDSHPCTRPH